jgi:glycosyltransferase involved in cell wall biosynthesis
MAQLDPGPEVTVDAGAPRVSIGLPVYNGESFIESAIDSLLGQSYTDFELVIGDNASTDRTEAICRARAEHDPRVRYFRHSANVGAMRNFNRVFELSRGEYFKWAAHDDVHEPDYLLRCVEVLDADRDVVLVYPRSREIDEHGHTLRTLGTGMITDVPRPRDRFRVLIRRQYSCVAVFGLMRSEMLRHTGLLANYADCDRVLLAEIGLAGRIRELPDPLFVHRQHRNRSVWQYRSRQTRSAWFDPARAGRPAFPYGRQFRGYCGAIARAPLPAAERAACALRMLAWIAQNADGLAEDVSYAARWALRPLKRRIVPAPRGGETAEGREK